MTGASVLETAYRFWMEGARVALVNIIPIGLDTALAILRSRLPQEVSTEANIKCIQADVTEEAEVKRYIEETVTAFGGLDIIFLCAGVSYTKARTFEIRPFLSTIQEHQNLKV